MDALEQGGGGRICRSCHADLAAGVNAAVCPACGGALAAQPMSGSDEPGMPARAVDRRGILLPRRHAVGGIITPR